MTEKFWFEDFDKNTKLVKAETNFQGEDLNHAKVTMHTPITFAMLYRNGTRHIISKDDCKLFGVDYNAGVKFVNQNKVTW